MVLKNLCIVCHPDDEILGFGSTAAKLVHSKEKVKVVFLCSGVEKRNIRSKSINLNKEILKVQNFMNFENPTLGTFPNLEFNNIEHFKLVQFIEKQIIEFNPHRIFIHHPYDINDDHRYAAKASLVAARYFQRNNKFKSNLNSIYAMEILSSTDWNFDSNNFFKPNHFVEINNFLDKKIKALELYKNVFRSYPNPRSKIVIKALSKIRASQSGCKEAEAFQCFFNKNI